MKIDYNRHFPSLQSLSIWEGHVLRGRFESCSFEETFFGWEKFATSQAWMQCYDLFKLFFPFLPRTCEQLDVKHDNVPDTIFKNVVYLSIPFDEDCPERMKLIANAFPNAHNKWLNQIRQKRTDDDSNQTSIMGTNKRKQSAGSSLTTTKKAKTEKQ